jgi:hypothetical protein
MGEQFDHRLVDSECQKKRFLSTLLLTFCLIHYPSVSPIFGIPHWFLDHDSGQFLIIGLLAVTSIGIVYYAVCTFGTLLAIGQYRLWWIAVSLTTMLPPLYLCTSSLIENWQYMQ